MKINLSDKIIAWLTLFSGLSISAVAVWYSVAGLVSIFAAATVPIIIMGVALEVSKLVATIWLKMNWTIAPRLIKIYLISAITILMLITSMGIFGFLSKAHLDQNLVSGDVQGKISIYDEKIKTAKDNIDANRKALKQMDEAVDQVMARSTSETGADKAVAIRRGQAKERARLQNEIAAEQKTISSLSEERAPIAAEVRKVEAEVGPIKYIAALLYGENPDANILDKAVTWVIIIIVVVFDPLAVVLLLASQFSFQYFRKRNEEDSGLEIFAGNAQIIPTPEPKIEEPVVETPKPADNYAYLHTDKSFWDKPEGWVSVPPQVYKAEEPKDEFTEDDYDNLNTVREEDDHDILNNAEADEAAAMAAWKHDHPDSSLKLQRRLFDKGVISQLPWTDYLKPKADYVSDNDAATEALKWAQEQLEERPGDYITKPDGISYMENVDGHQVKKTIEGYQQNAEQDDNTLWKRIKKGSE